MIPSLLYSYSIFILGVMILFSSLMFQENSGNILKKEIYNLQNNQLLKIDTYEYNNLNWKDQLTKYNDTSITYDEIGNPLLP